MIGRDAARSTAERWPRGVLALRLLILTLACGAVAVSLVATRAPSVQQVVRYVCPMHPDVTSTTPSTCPICGMKLEPVVTGKPNGIKPSTYLSYDIARRRAYGPDALAPAWVEGDGSVWAVLYLDELAFRAAGERAILFPASAPASGVEVTAAADAPSPWDRSTARVRFRAEPGLLHSGETGWLKRPRSPEPAVVPYAAILEETAGPYVLVASTDGHSLAKRSVEIGRVFGGAAAVLSGLAPADRVLSGSAFFVDAERRLRAESAVDVASR